jgi:hypothetical protein
MKAIGSKSITNILFFIINVVWWLEWIAFSIVSLVFVITSFSQKYININLPISFSPVNFKSVAALNNDLLNGSLKVMNGNFSFLLHNSFRNTFICLIGLVAVFSFILLITHQIKLIFASFSNNDPFNELNIKRMNLIGVLLIGFSFLELIFNIFIDQYLKSQFDWKEGMSLTAGYNVTYLLTGLILIIIAGIIKLGASLENETKLTI